MIRSYAKFASTIALFLSIVCVTILELTDMRLLTPVSNAEKINNVMLTLSYSFIGAYLFYWLNDWLPMRFRRRIAEAYIKREIRQLRELLRLCMLSFSPYSMPSVTSLAKDEFLRIAVQRDLKDNTISGSDTILDQLNIYKEKIIEICECLLSSYYSVMTDEQTKFVDEMLNSYFVANVISPINYDLPDEYIDGYPNNQQEISESIYDSYQKIKRLIRVEDK